MLTTRKWIGLTLGVLVLLVAFGGLSYWQWQRAQQDRVDAPPVVASDVLSASALEPSAYGTKVAIAGTYDVAHQVLVRHSDTAYWVVTPLRPAIGPAVAIARATVSSPTDPAVASVTAGTVTVIGLVQPFEGDPGGATTLPSGQVERLTASALDLPYPSAGGWIALQSQAPEPSVAAAPVVAPISGESNAPIRLQNASYAVQWVLFAAFVLFFWARMLRDDLRVGDPRRPQQAASPVREVY